MLEFRFQFPDMDMFVFPLWDMRGKMNFANSKAYAHVALTAQSKSPQLCPLKPGGIAMPGRFCRIHKSTI